MCMQKSEDNFWSSTLTFLLLKAYTWLIGPWASKQFCLCLPSCYNSVGVTDVHHYTRARLKCASRGLDWAHQASSTKAYLVLGCLFSFSFSIWQMFNNIDIYSNTFPFELYFTCVSSVLVVCCVFIFFFFFFFILIFWDRVLYSPGLPWIWLCSWG